MKTEKNHLRKLWRVTDGFLNNTAQHSKWGFEYPKSGIRCIYLTRNSISHNAKKENKKIKKSTISHGLDALNCALKEGYKTLIYSYT